MFAATDVDRFLKSDSTLYRIMDVTKQSPNFPAYHFEQHILGYHSAKLRKYQDLLDVAGNGQMPTSPLAWNILNTKYLIVPPDAAAQFGGMPVAFTSREKKAVVLRNDAAMPRAWFVNRVEKAAPLDILNKIKEGSFDPHDVAFVSDGVPAGIEPSGYVASTPSVADSTAPAAASSSVSGSTAQVTLFKPLHISVDVNATGRNYLVLSEISYPPGWSAKIDGTPAAITPTDYLLRGIVIPKGHHTVTLDYVSHGFVIGKWVSLVLNLIVLALLGFGIALERRRARREDADPRHDSPEIAFEDV